MLLRRKDYGVLNGSGEKDVVRKIVRIICG